MPTIPGCIWCTDIHLDHLPRIRQQAFYQSLRDRPGDTILITGDIGDAEVTPGLLTDMQKFTGKTIYFVLGNHDYYFSDVATVRAKMTHITATNPKIQWLPASGPVRISGTNKILVGHDTWADGRYGDYTSSHVELNDAIHIADLRGPTRTLRLEHMQRLADADAAELANMMRDGIAMIRDAIASMRDGEIEEMIVLVHVPPFMDACRHNGQISSPAFLPFFASQVTGDTLRAIATEFPHVQFTVLCGHTHSPAEYVEKNLAVYAGASEYGAPSVVQ